MENELITNFAKKGFLLDRESIDFFSRLGDFALSEEILNKIVVITRSRMISRKMLNDKFKETRDLFKQYGIEKQSIVDEFYELAKLKSCLEGNKSTSEINTCFVDNNISQSNLKIISSEIIPYRRIEVKDFVTHFRNRYNFFKSFLMDRKELSNLVSINKIGTNRTFSIIGLVKNKRVTKNKNVLIDVEDLTGKISVLIGHDKEEMLKKASEVVLDDVIGIKCSGNGEFVYANDILFLDSFIAEKKKSDEEGYAIFISDIHVGSKLFLGDKFMKFLKWINCEGEIDEVMKEKIKKIKYVFITGDNVDGVGAYPGQEVMLEIKDCKSQYKKLAELLNMIPKHIKIIMCPGQHDAVRVPEPQPAIGEDFAKDIVEMKNMYLVCNPAVVEIESKPGKRGIQVLMYHGASMHGWIDAIEDLRQGQANLNPSKVVKYMLRHRHLSPMHSENVYVPNEREDTLILKEVPDILATGDMHRTDIDIYNNVLIICGSCWQSITPFEEKVGNQPDPCKVPMLNLKTREIKLLDFT